MKIQSSITSTLLYGTIFLIVLIFSVGGFVVINSSKVIFENIIKDDVKLISLHTKMHYDIEIRNLIDELNIISKSNDIEKYNQNYQKKLIEEKFIQHKGSFKILGYLDKKEQLIAKIINGKSNQALKDINSQFRIDLFKKAKLKPNNVVCSDIIYSKILDKSSILFVKNIINFFDEDMGFIVGMITAKDIFKNSILATSKEYKYIILDNNNNIVFTSQKYNLFKEIKIDININDSSLIKKTIKDIEYYIYSKKYNFGTVIVSLPYSYFQNMVINTIKDNIAIFFLLLFISILLVYIISRKITKPLRELVYQLNNNKKLNIQSNYKDITILSTTFNNQRDGLLEINKNLEQRVTKEVDKNIAKELLLFEQSKMASMGSMIGNIAHQWRQPLSMISAIASGMKLKQKNNIFNEKELPQYMDSIIDKTVYLSETITTFRNFLKEKKEIKEVILQERIDVALSIAGLPLKDSGIKLRTNIDYDTPIYITLVAGELPEVIINIINNARDILLARKIKDPWVKVELTKENNNNIIITIEDNGEGIPQNILPRIFDEYFTTKEDDIGTGLGLYMSNQIITKSLKGKLYIENTKNGAKFFIELPI